MYYTIFAALMVLTVVTVLVARVDLGVMNTVVAMTVAVAKALLVVLYFMHVRWSSQLTKVFVATGFLWLIILIAMTLSDFWTRNWIEKPQGW
jgi:cytochrome c oxidase subunit 4